MFCSPEFDTSRASRGRCPQHLHSWFRMEVCVGDHVRAGFSEPCQPGVHMLQQTKKNNFAEISGETSEKEHKAMSSTAV